MPLTLSHCHPTDSPSLALASHATWSAMPRNRVAFGNVPRAQLLKMYEKNVHDGMTVTKQYKLPQQKYFLKVTDDATGEIAASAVWIYLPERYSAEDEYATSKINVSSSGLDTESLDNTFSIGIPRQILIAEVYCSEEVVMGPLPEGTNEGLIRDFCKMTGELRAEHPGRHEAHWLLWLLGTHPKYERKGAGAQLVRWAFPQADAAGLRCYVDASELGHSLYRKCGFEDVGEMILDLDKYEGGEGRGVQRWVAMVREPQKTCDVGH